MSSSERRRPLPPELADAFAHLRRLEQLTDRRQHRQHAARRATGRLLLACTLEGWRVSELVDAAGIAPRTAGYRIAEARRRGGHVGLVVPAPPRTAHTVAPNPSKLSRDPDWLTLREAVLYTGAAGVTINVWDKWGLLPNTRRVNARRHLYSRSDLDLVTTGPRTNRGVNRRALATQLGAHQAAASAL